MADLSKTRQTPIRIAVIDSGIDLNKPGLDNCVIASTGFEVNKDGYIAENLNMKARHEHGTIIAMIIRHICNDVQFVDINILDENLSCDGRILITAMEKALEYEPDIMHLSLGTTKFRYKSALQRIVNTACKLNCLTVAAANNRNIKSYPAFLKNVIAVKCSMENDKRSIYYRDGFWFAPPSAAGVAGIEQMNYCNMMGSSMAAAYITGYMAKAYFCQ
jgi:hypothetical protein